MSVYGFGMLKIQETMIDSQEKLDIYTVGFLKKYIIYVADQLLAEVNKNFTRRHALRQQGLCQAGW